jgi:hypothetical protein
MRLCSKFLFFTLFEYLFTLFTILPFKCRAPANAKRVNDDYRHSSLFILSLMLTMAPPLTGPQFSAETISGITGSISIACWLVVFSPQIIENFRRRSGEGLSLSFLVIWLAGDVFNVLGAILQHVLPTMIILAIYCISYG